MNKKTLNTISALSLAVLVSASNLPLAVAATAPTVPSSFTLNGAGWGHGVGMSQYGAYGMALEGKTSTQILEHYYNPAKVSNTTSYNNTDILVQVLNATKTSTITPSNGSLRVKFSGKTIQSAKPVTFTLDSCKITATIDGKAYSVSDTSNFTIEWQNTRYWNSGKNNTTIKLPLANDNAGTVNYRHGKMVVSKLNSKLNFINSVRLNDEYLYGLAEMPSSWAPAALESQAIAGRTYAMKNMNYKTACGCNVYDEVKSQKFTGWNKENEANGYIGARWVKAVNNTLTRNSDSTIKNSKVILHKGKLIDAVYSSSTGGKTRTSADVWGSPHEYLQIRDDHWALKPEVKNPNSNWTGTITKAKAETAYKLKNIKSISVASYKDGTIASSTALSTDGKKSMLTGVATRTLFNAKSKWVKNIVGNGTATGTTEQNKPSTTGTDSQIKPSTVKPKAPAVTSIAKNVKYKTSIAKNVKYKTTSALNIRKGAGTSNKVVKVLAKNAIVTTTGKSQGGWYEVKSDKATGWVSASYLKKDTTAAKTPAKKTEAKHKAVAKKTTGNLNLRNGAGVKHKVVIVLKKNTTVYLTGKKSNKWVEIKIGKKSGWVSSAYLK